MASKALVLIELGGVVLGLGVLARLAGNLGISPIPFYLVGGLLLGEGGLVPVVTSEEFIEIGAELGVVFLLLMLGLEYSADELVASLRLVAPAGLVDLVLNFTPGWVAGMLLGWGPAPAVYLGVVTYISSSGVVAKLLGDLGWSGNRETPTVLSILVFEDLAMAVLLPILGVLAVGSSPLGAVTTAGVALLVVVAVILLVSRSGERIGSVVFHHSDEANLLTLFGFTLLVAGLAERLHISAAVGAFLVGLSLSGEGVHRARGLLGPLRDLFAAVFFVFFGLSTDPRTIPPVLLPALLLALVTAATKVATGWWAAARSGVGARGRLRAGVALVARGEFSIVVAGLGAGAFGVDLGPIAAAYVLILAIAGPLAARAVVAAGRVVV
ncbi:MAG: potassium transporter [Acidimicrobiia bacterium]|nr:MAG: potassium transporter [Acidimicrobiia bacterium]